MLRNSHRKDLFVKSCQEQYLMGGPGSPAQISPRGYLSLPGWFFYFLVRQVHVKNTLMIRARPKEITLGKEKLQLSISYMLQ